MPPAPKFTGIVTNGQLEIEDKEKLSKYLRGIEGKVSIIIKRYRDRLDRSNNQNKYYWSVPVDLIAEYTGYTPDETHEALRMMFLRKYDDRIMPSIRSTTELSTVEFEDYMKQIRQWASMDLQLYIPLPNETEYDYLTTN